MLTCQLTSRAVRTHCAHIYGGGKERSFETVRYSALLKPHPRTAAWAAEPASTAPLNLDKLPSMRRYRIKLLHGSLIYRDKRLPGYDAAAVVEVIEHLDPPRLAPFERVLFECARPEHARDSMYD